MQSDIRAFQWRETRLITGRHFPNFIAPGFQAIKTEYEYFIFCTFFYVVIYWFIFIFSQTDSRDVLKHDDKSVLFSFFNNILEGMSPFLWSHWYSCFGLLVTSLLGFKARVDTLACVLRHQRATDSSSILEISGVLLKFFSLNLNVFVFKIFWTKSYLQSRLYHVWTSRNVNLNPWKCIT